MYLQNAPIAIKFGENFISVIWVLTVKVAQERDKLKTESVTNNEKAAELIKLVEERLRMDALRTESQSKIDYLQNQLEVKSNLITEVTQERDKFKSECLTNNGKVAKLIEENLRMDAIKTESQSKIESLQNQLEVKRNLVNANEVTQEWEWDTLLIESLTHCEEAFELIEVSKYMLKFESQSKIIFILEISGVYVINKKYVLTVAHCHNEEIPEKVIKYVTDDRSINCLIGIML